MQLQLIPLRGRSILKSPLTASSAEKKWYVQKSRVPGSHADILVFGKGSSEDEALVANDQNLRSLMKRCGGQNITNKVKLRYEKVPFLGHLKSKDGLKADPAKIITVLEIPTLTDVVRARGSLGSQITWESFYLVSVMYVSPSGNSQPLM